MGRHHRQILNMSRMVLDYVSRGPHGFDVVASGRQHTRANPCCCTFLPMWANRAAHYVVDTPVRSPTFLYIVNIEHPVQSDRDPVMLVHYQWVANVPGAHRTLFTLVRLGETWNPMMLVRFDRTAMCLQTGCVAFSVNSIEPCAQCCRCTFAP